MTEWPCLKEAQFGGLVGVVRRVLQGADVISQLFDQSQQQFLGQLKATGPQRVPVQVCGMRWEGKRERSRVSRVNKMETVGWEASSVRRVHDEAQSTVPT
jgi:hypothetical protein